MKQRWLKSYCKKTSLINIKNFCIWKTPTYLSRLSNNLHSLPNTKLHHPLSVQDHSTTSKCTYLNSSLIPYANPISGTSLITAVAAAFIKSNARLSFGFSKSYFAENLRSFEYTIGEYKGVQFGMGVREMGGFTYGTRGRLSAQRCKWRGVGWWIVRMFLRIRTWSWPWVVGALGRAGKVKRFRGLKIERDQV